MGFLKGSQPQMIPPTVQQATPPPPTFGQIQGQKPAKKPQAPTYLGKETRAGPGASPSDYGLGSTQQGKTLLGQ